MDGRMDQSNHPWRENGRSSKERKSNGESLIWRAIFCQARPSSSSWMVVAEQELRRHGRTRSFASVFVPATPGDIGTRAILVSAGFSNSLFEKSKTESSSNAAKGCFRVIKICKLENVGYKKEKKIITMITSKSSSTKEVDQKANQQRGECRQGAEQ
uniref:Uncharacterized protein n=1 Tax=Oryza glumipatula TaxID=40148 RepID=A0A0E0B9Y1_9ORYZ